MAGIKDFATGIVVTAPSPATSGVTLTLQVGEGARMPAVPFFATAHPATEMPTLDNAEKISVTDVTGDVLTIVRAQGDTTAKSIAAGWRVSNALFADDIAIALADLTDDATHRLVTDTEKSTWNAKEDAGVAASAVSTHASQTTGVHGVGAGTIAKTSDITDTKLDDFATPDDNTDLNANTTSHGLLLKATAPAAGLMNVVGIANGETSYANKALFDATVPSTQAFGDAAATGSATVSARRDHKHAMPAAPTSVSGDIIVTAAPGSDHTATGMKIVLTAASNIAFGDVCYIASTGKATLIDADAIASMSAIVMCADATISADASGNFLLMGVARDDTWNWTVGGIIYGTVTGTTANTLSQTAPSGTDDVVQIMGVATHADRMFFNPQLVQIERT